MYVPELAYGGDKRSPYTALKISLSICAIHVIPSENLRFFKNLDVGRAMLASHDQRYRRNAHLRHREVQAHKL